MMTSAFFSGRVFRVAAVAIGAFGFSACVISERPLITTSDPLAGQRFNVTIYKHFDNGRALFVDQRHYVWADQRYVAAWSRPEGVTHLSAVSLGNDLLVQRTDKSAKVATYWVARPIFAGAYRVFPVDENALSPEERRRLCAGDEPEEFCLVKSYDQLLAIAKATARRGVPAGPDLAVLTEDATN